MNSFKNKTFCITQAKSVYFRLFTKTQVESGNLVDIKPDFEQFLNVYPFYYFKCLLLNLFSIKLYR